MLALQLDLVEDASCKTAWTDGTSLGFNPAFVATLDTDEIEALFAHEVMHCACGHPWRRDGRDTKQWNVAADYAINGILRDARFKLPSGALIDARFNGKSSEWIYDRLPQGDGESGSDGSGDPQSGSGEGNDPSGQGEVRDAPEPNGDEQSTDGEQPSEASWKQITKQAERMAAGQGTLSARLKRDIDAATASQVDWRSALIKYAQETVKADYSWTRPNSRYLAVGLYLPSLHSVACGHFVVGVDTSGSVDAVLLQQFAGAINAIADTLQPSRIDVIYCDSQVNHVDTFARGETVTMEPHGGGGTCFEPVFEHVAETGETPAVLIYLTDMYGSFPETAPDYPVIWASYSSVDVAPFGDVIPCQ